LSFGATECIRLAAKRAPTATLQALNWLTELEDCRQAQTTLDQFWRCCCLWLSLVQPADLQLNQWYCYSHRLKFKFMLMVSHRSSVQLQQHSIRDQSLVLAGANSLFVRSNWLTCLSKQPHRFYSAGVCVHMASLAPSGIIVASQPTS
jgi:hypothetical protein